jgi:hypothetical protein
MKILFKICLLVFAFTVATGCADHQFSATTEEPIPNDGSDVTPPGIKGPSILVLKAPNSTLSIDDEVSVEYQVVQGTAPIEKIECVWNTISVPCSPDKDRLFLRKGKLGKHKMKIVVTDKNNLQDEKTLPWELFEKFKKHQTAFAVTATDNQIDVLFVVDNSPSMKDEQKSMATKIESFMDRVKGFDWQIGVVTTDPAHHLYGDGQLQKYPNGSYILKSNLDAQTAKNLFGQTVQREETGSSSEQGIRATNRAIQRSLGSKPDPEHKQFFRDQSALAVVVLSDENESGAEMINSGSELLKLVDKTWGAQKVFQFHSIIVRPGDEKCRQAATVGDHYFGTAYARLTKLTNGVLGSICEPDYGNQLRLIGQSVANSKTTYDLDCKPKDLNGDGNADVLVTMVGGKPVPNFVITDSQIIFSKPPEAGQYMIDYFCPQK